MRHRIGARARVPPSARRGGRLVAVAEAAHGLDRRRLQAGRGELGAQVADVDLHAARVAGRGVPREVEQRGGRRRGRGGGGGGGWVVVGCVGGGGAPPPPPPPRLRQQGLVAAR